MDRRFRKSLASALIAAALSLGGCGLATRDRTSAIAVTVTRDFGATRVATATARPAGGSETVARLLERSFAAQLGTRGRIVSIEGLSSGRWFYYVNGIGFTTDADRTKVHGGDHLWLDLHDPTVASSSPAVVGAFPEPFLHGIGGRGLPTTLECGSGVSAACARVTATLSDIGVPVSSQLLGAPSGQESLAVEVAPWSQLRGQIVASLLDVGPSQSGVYARFSSPDGRTLQLLDARGRAVRTLGPGAGLIAATRDLQSEPTWLITGTDSAGVMAAARALSAGNLRGRFALAVSMSGPLAVPLR